MLPEDNDGNDDTGGDNNDGHNDCCHLAEAYTCTVDHTSGSAMAERPRDVCLTSIRKIVKTAF